MNLIKLIHFNRIILSSAPLLILEVKLCLSLGWATKLQHPPSVKVLHFIYDQCLLSQKANKPGEGLSSQHST